PVQLTDGKFQALYEPIEPMGNRDDVRRLVLGSGKIMVEVIEDFEKSENQHAIHFARVEQIYPFPVNELKDLLNEYKNIEEIVWLQEESKNMGSWDFVKERIQNIKKERQKLT